jgi:hypothetical protein
MEVYRITYDNSNLDEEFEGVYAISLVDDPANEMQFVMLSKNKNVLKLKSKEKRLLTGVVLIPNQKIYRKDDNGKEYEIFFEADVIEKLSQDFLRNGFHKNSTYNHLDNAWLEDISVVEQWIIEDPEKDKSTALGFTGLPKGTWMVTFKVSEDIWEDYVKTGKVKGFSIDAFLDMEKIKMNNKKLKPKKMSLFKRIRMALATSLMQQISVDGMDLFSENFAVGDEVFYQDELLISKSFTYDGYVYVTDENGIIVSKEPVAEGTEMEDDETVESVEEMVSEIEDLLSDILDEVQMKKLKAKLAKKTKLEEIAEKEAEEIEDIVKDIVEEVSDTEDVDVEALQELVEDLQEKVEELETENAELKAKLSTQPNTTKLKATKIVASEGKLKGKASILNAVLNNKN